MVMTRGMIAKQKRPKSCDNDGHSASWAYLIHDILFSVILRLGVVDFVAFSGVCRSWRTVALSNRNMFLLTRRPMSMCISMQVAKKKECCLEDSEGRTFKTILPRSSGRTCVGLTCGYLILFGRKSYDFWLVNPITRHELYFPRFPFHVVPNPDIFRCTLIFSTTMSTWVFLISTRFSCAVSFALSSKRASWTHLISDFPIWDLHFFKGKIYTLNVGIRLCEVRLNPTPTLTLLKMNNLVKSELIFPEFATLGEKLCVMGYRSKDLYGTVEIDFDQMRWMNPTKALSESTCFASTLRCGFTKLEFWTYPREQFERFGYFSDADKDKIKRGRVTADMWYFPHKCLDVNVLHG